MNAKAKATNSIPSLQKVLVVGNGGRENALAWALSKCPEIKKIYVAPGNGGTEDYQSCTCLKIEPSNQNELIDVCLTKKIDLIVIGPEVPLALGLADAMRQAGLCVFGPSAEGAKLEASKDWAKQLMREANIPTANYWKAQSKQEAIDLLKNFDDSLVVKADGLASGKGVTVCKSKNEAMIAINEAFEGKFGNAGTTLILEELLEGPEVSIFALTDGEEFLVLPTAQDHKRLLDNDEGPNTGGMGAYAPAKILNDNKLDEIKSTIIKPTINALRNRSINYRGVIYAGLMITSTGPKVIEFNCRFGDPECQALMPLMGKEFGKILHACALGCLKKAPPLSVKNLCSVCIVAASDGYPIDPQLGDEISIKITQSSSLQVFQAGTQKNNFGKLVTSGGRVLSLVSQASDFQEAFDNAYEGLNKISFKGIHYRKDIGKQVRDNLSRDASND